MEIQNNLQGKGNLMNNEKLAVVTGASRGIGRSISLSLAKSGYNTALLGRSTSALFEVKKLCEGLGVMSNVFEVDMLELHSFGSLKDQILEKFGRIDVLVNNAGTGGHGKIHEVSADRLLTCIKTNYIGLVELTREFSRDMIKQEDAAIINIASITSRTTYSGGAAYSSSKHAVLGFTGCLFEDLREFGVKVCAILPGYVDTEMVDSPGLVRDKLIAPDDIAHCVDYVLNSSARVCPTEIVLRPQFSPYSK